MSDWAADELRSLDLGDRRLNQRRVRLAGGLAARPAHGVPQALPTWAATQAAYRFWDNPRVSPQDIHAAHRRATRQRLPAEGPVLALQDATGLDFTHHPAAQALGYLGHPRHRGLWVHSALCVGAAGVPRGLLHQQCWTRPLSDLGKRRRRNHALTRDKGSRRWLTAGQATAAALPAGRTAITVADRGADFYDLFAAPRGANGHLLIRARPRRRVRHELGLLGPAVQAQPAAGTLDVGVPRRPGQPARPARL